MKNLDQINFDLLCLGLGVSLGNLQHFKEGVMGGFHTDREGYLFSEPTAQAAYETGRRIGSALRLKP
jgi:phosphoheptose isomerase